MAFIDPESSSRSLHGGGRIDPVANVAAMFGFAITSALPVLLVIGKYLLPPQIVVRLGSDRIVY
jgi:hypothetical protein